MAKFSGVVGYGHSMKTAPGVWEDVITERPHFGDIQRTSRTLEENPQKVNSDLTVGNSISIVADPFASENFFAIRYVKWAGTLWTVVHVDVQSPRLLLRLGGVYNGPTPRAPEPPGDSDA